MIKKRTAGETRDATVDVPAWMRKFAADDAGESTAPDPTHLWWKAQVLRHWDAQRRATAPLDLAELVQVAVSVAAVIVLVPWLWREIAASATLSGYVPSAVFGSSILLASAVAAVVCRFRSRESQPSRPGASSPTARLVRRSAQREGGSEKPLERQTRSTVK